MGYIETFSDKVKALAPERRADLEKVLETFFIQTEREVYLSPEQEAELARRMADPNPKFVEMKEVEAMFGRKFKT